MALVQRVLLNAVPGIKFDEIQTGAPFLVYADDGMLLADSANTLQRAIDVLWMTSTAIGLNVFIKNKKKTAWAGVTYRGGSPEDMQGWKMRFPDAQGTEIPQLVGGEKYTYLGTELPTAWQGKRTHEATRRHIVEACVNVTRRIGYLEISPHEMRRAILSPTLYQI